MGKLTKEEICKIARLAKLELSSSEVEKFQNQLSDVIDFVDQLREVNVKNQKPTSQTTGLESVNREDQISVENSLSEKEALSGTENTLNGYVKIPAIFDEL